MTRMDEKFPRGLDLLHDPMLNKGTAFTDAERDALGLHGLLPPHVQTEEEQLKRVLANLRRKATALERYIFLVALLDRNETLFYRTIIDNIEEMLPLIYTPTVGQACQEFSHIFRRTRGLYVSATDRGRVAKVLENWPTRDVRVIVVTDGERILGLGDLGANGIGIPIGKLVLYTACAGIPPSQCLPVTIDVGTNNTALLADPLYLGLHQRRIRGEQYESLLDEFIMAATKIFPQALIQFEDFARDNAFRLLAKYRQRVCCFNDDIQGTAAVVLAGLYSALRITSDTLADQRLLFFGAGEAGTGIAKLVIAAMVNTGLPESEARRRCWFVDSKGLVVNRRDDLAEYKRLFACDHEFLSDGVSIIEMVRPTALIGTTGRPGAFSHAILQAVAKINERPIVFALSNPTSVAECTAQEAYEHTNGQAVFASGSPFDPVTIGDKAFAPAQGNNAYVFPGIGLGVIASASRLVSDQMFLAAARALAKQVSATDLDAGRVYPRLKQIREVSISIAVAVVETACRQNLARREMPEDLHSYIRSMMFQPEYISYT
ncbi:MAG TPA: NAD-dependent malic enzyme [Candidatus Udaeobacter sp.]|nr:NAD-dependent malic enzyme [Candidatus Udaeobacter sp.]